MLPLLFMVSDAEQVGSVIAAHLTDSMASRSCFKLHSRSFASLSSSQVNAGQSPFRVFDRHAKRTQKDRAVARDGGNRSRTVDYVRNEVADRMMERFLASIHYDELISSMAKKQF